MVRSVRPVALAAFSAVLAVLAAAGCSQGLRGAPLSEPSKRLVAEAKGLRPIEYEEDYIDARLLYRALPLNAPERAPLRHKLLAYLLGPLQKLDATQLQQQGGDVGVSDDLDRVATSFRDALEQFAPEELWASSGPTLASDERALVKQSAELVATLFASRGAETEVATALLVLTTLEPANQVWSDRLNELLAWIDTGAQLSLSGSGPRAQTTPTDILEAAAAAWPAPAVVDRLAQSYVDRQDKVASLLRRPLGAVPSRGAIGDLLLEGEGVQTTGLAIAGLYLRCGQLTRAAGALAKTAGKPGEDPDLRQLVDAAASKGAPEAALLALSRRFLPRIDLLGGTSTDRVDLPAALALAARAALAYPQDPEPRVLASRIALFMQEPYLSLRYLEEAQPLLEKAGGARDDQAELASEILERSFAKLRLRMVDSDRIEPAAREAEVLRRRYDEARQRFGENHLKARSTDIDFELARGMLNAGQVDRAEELLQRAARGSESRSEVALELAKLAGKRGDARRATEILEQTLEQHRADAPDQDTIGFVENQSKLAYALGNVHEIAGHVEDARKAWRISLRGWERLMLEQLRRKSLGASAAATMEVGRLDYLLGRQQDGVAKFVEAIEQNEGRDQSYIDALSFLVQRGDVEAALDIYRRAMSKPSRTVSEYVKVYASLWILDLTRRSGREPEPASLAFLRFLDARKVSLRPMRAAAWYVELARYALGRISYEALLPRADTAGKRAELYFYEAMHRLSEGRNDDAHALWNKVLETHMVEFLEFDMASRYLRTGAPTQARPEPVGSETI
jgi:tetratricopeptide (TPR) repeat protein